MKVVFSDRAYAAVLAETTEKIKTETGGLFLGAVEDGVWYIVEAIDPGPKSIFEVAYFEYDQQYTQHLINKVANLYKERLSLIGLWHRHPGSFDVFSGTDNGTNTKYAAMRQEGAISALVNIDPKFRLTVYHVGQPCQYEKIGYQVGNDLIPDHYLRLRPAESYEQLMQDMLNPQRRKDEFHVSVSLNSFMKTLKPLFGDRAYKKKLERRGMSPEEMCDKVVETILSDVMFMSDEVGIKMSVVRQNEHIALVQDAIDGVAKVFFLYSESDESVLFHYDGENYVYEDGLFENLYHMADEKIRSGRNIIQNVFRLIKTDRNGG